MNNKTLDIFFKNYEEKAFQYYEKAYNLIKENDLRTDKTTVQKWQFASNLVTKALASDFRNAYSFNSLLDKDDKCYGGLYKRVQKETKRKRLNLIAKVTKKVGTITNLQYITLDNNGNINGLITGEKGTCTLETIGAGGYNIQRYHYRVLIK